ncbi:cadherin domain-containing protein [Hyphococcus sp.]|uniref:cadherin domain-containing protein n=1 Tax=Hyphococcus sp. TaxID=2038636 RepID=UPI0035C69F2F
MAQDKPGVGENVSNSTQNISQDREAEDAAYKNDRESLKNARDGDTVDADGGDDSGGYANLHFGKQNLNTPQGETDRPIDESDPFMGGRSNRGHASRDADLDGDDASQSLTQPPGFNGETLDNTSYELKSPEATTEGEAFEVSALANPVSDRLAPEVQSGNQRAPEALDTRNSEPMIAATSAEIGKGSDGDIITSPEDNKVGGDNIVTPPEDDEPSTESDQPPSNEAPVDIIFSGGPIAENLSSVVIGNLLAVDNDANESFVFSIINDESDLFELDGNTLKLKEGVSFDFEQSESHDVALRVTDSAGNSYDEVLTVNVSNANEAPFGLGLSSLDIAENMPGGTVGALFIADPDAGDAISFIVSDERFEIVGNDLKLKEGVFLDAETSGPVDLTITATDAGGLSASAGFTVNVTDVNEIPILNVVSESGLRASYYNIGHALSDLDEVDFNAEPDARGVVDSLDYMDGGELFWEGAPGNYFAAKYEGNLIVEEGGAYTFDMASDDGSMLFIDGVAVLDNDGLHSTRTRTTTLDLDAGSHDIEVRYFENSGSQTLQLAWSGPDTGGVTEVINGASFEHGHSIDNLTVADDAAGAIIARLTVVDPDIGDTHSFSVNDDRFEVAEQDGAFYLKLKDDVSIDYEHENELIVEITATDASGASNTLSLPITVEDVNHAPTISIVGGEGLQASYFDVGHSLSDLNEVDFDAVPDAEGVVDSLNYTAGKESFWDGAPGDYFAAKYEGQLLVEEGGSYTFDMSSDDGSMLFIDGVAVLDNDGLHSTRTRSVTMDLEAGSHDIEVRYFENGGSQTLQLSWAGPDTGGASEVIGGESFRLPGFTDADRLGVTENASGDIAARFSIADAEGDVIAVTASDDRFEIVEDADGYILKLKEGVDVNYESESEVPVTITATDEHGEAISQSFSVPVINVNEAPVEFTLASVSNEGRLVLNADGGNDDAAIAANMESFPTDALTVEVRFSSDQTDVGDGAPLFSYAANDGSNNEVLIWLEGSSGNLHLYLAGQKVNTGVPNASLLDGEEHQVSFTWDQATNELAVYVDGDSAFESMLSIRDLKAGGSLAFGQEQDSETGGFDVDQIFQGEIAEVRIFDYARSHIEISENAGVTLADPEAEPGLVNNWLMGSSDGGFITDLVGADDLQLINGASVEGGEVFDTPTVLENRPGAVAGVLSATDPDTGSAVSNFSIVSDPSGAFEIDGNQLKLKDGVTLDYETQDVYEIVIEADGFGGESAQQTFTVNVANENESPIDFALDPASAEKVLSLNQDGGIDDAAIASDLESFPTDALTVEVRFSSQQTDVGNGTPLFSYSASDGSDNEALIWLEGSSGKLHLYLAGKKINTGVDNAELLDGNEHQVSFTWDQASNELKVYVDGEMAFDSTVDIRDLKANGTLAFGQEQDAEGGVFDIRQVFEGEIAEVRIFDYARSDVEIADNLGAPIGSPDTEPGLVNNWVMNAESNGAIEDLVGANDLQLTNGAAVQNSVNSATPLVAENDPGAMIGALSATDRVTGEPISNFAIVDDSSGLFEIDGNQLKLKDGAAFDYEAQHSHEVVIEAIAENGETTQMTVAVQVSDISEITGTDGSDRLTGTSGDDLISGEEGVDTVVFSGNRADYTIEQIDEESYQVTDNRADSPDGVDIVRTTENFEFADQTIGVENILNTPPTDISLELASNARLTDASVSDANIDIADGGGSDTAQVDLSGAIDGSAAITISFATIDNSFELFVNGQSLTNETVQLQSNVYDAVTQAFLQFGDGEPIDTPWVANDDGSPRLVAQITSDGVEILATRTPSSGAYETMTLVNGDFTAPSLVDGMNTVTVDNPDDNGPDGVSAVVSAQFAEPVEGPVSGEEGAIVGSLSSIDADAGAAATYAITEDVSGLFEINGDQVKVKDGMALDYDAQSSHEITVEVTDEHGAIYQETLTIDVQPESTAAQQLYGDADANVQTGGAGDDVIYGGAGDDTITGGQGDDMMVGGDGSDVFVYAMGDGSDEISGGAGWTDVIDLTDGAAPLGEFGTDWTVDLTEGAISSVTDDTIIFTDDAAGSISLNDGSVINFTEIEQLTY